MVNGVMLVMCQIFYYPPISFYYSHSIIEILPVFLFF